jgi:Protein of unknown function (DUF1579)
MTEADSVPKPTKPGPETEALIRFFPDVTWSGAIHENGMGPGTPPMTATGRGEHRLIQDGRWIVGNYEQDQYLLDGTFVLKWQLHWVVGWDPMNQEYRATIADNYGRADVMRGHIDGDRLIFETLGDAPVRIRLTWDATHADDLVWRNEMSVQGALWFLVEDYHMTPIDRAE